MNINDLDPDNSTYLNIKTFKQYLEATPELKSITISRVVKNGIAILRRCIEEPKDKGVSWEHPYIQLNYSVTKESRFTELPLITRHANTSFIDFQSIMFANLTDHIAYIYESDKDKDSYWVYLKEDSEEFEKLTPKRQQNIKEKLFKKYDDPKRKPTFNLPLSLVLKDTKGKQRRARGSLIINFLPLFIDEANNGAFYPLILGLDITTGYKPAYWSDEDKKGFWEYIDKTFKDISPQESFEFLDKLEEPEVKPVSRGTNLIKVGMHLEDQKFGRKPKPDQPSIFGLLDIEDRERREEHNIKIVGVDFTTSQNKALFALQTLLEKTDHKGNIEGKSVELKPFKYKGLIPSLKFTRSEYLDTYGVTKRQTSRRKFEYNANESEESLKALRSLSENRYLLSYTKKYFDEKRVEKYDVIRTVRSLINIIEGFKDLTESEKNTVISDKNSTGTNTKLSHIVVELSPIFIDQIENHYVLKPANVYEEIKIKAPHSSKFVHRFIDYLLAQVSKRQSKYKGNNINWEIKTNYKTLAHTLKMDSWIKTRNWKQVRGSLNKSYEIAKELGYLEGYKTIEGKMGEIELLTLNPDKFYRAKEIEEAREKIENEAGIQH